MQKLNIKKVKASISNKVITNKKVRFNEDFEKLTKKMQYYGRY